MLPFHVPLAASILAGGRVRVAAAVSFPGGGAPPEAKALEARLCMEQGAHELDLVLNLGAIRAGAWDVVATEIASVRAAAPACTSKWIVETGALTDGEIRKAVSLVADGGGDYVKTSTGYGPLGATVESVRLLRALAGTMGVKASGGIRTREWALRLVEAGADRIGTSAPRAVLAGEAAPPRPRAILAGETTPRAGGAGSGAPVRP